LTSQAQTLFAAFAGGGRLAARYIAIDATG
jgi:hypothetical protein